MTGSLPRELRFEPAHVRRLRATNSTVTASVGHRGVYTGKHREVDILAVLFPCDVIVAERHTGIALPVVRLVPRQYASDNWRLSTFDRSGHVALDHAPRELIAELRPNVRRLLEPRLINCEPERRRVG